MNGAADLGEPPPPGDLLLQVVVGAVPGRAGVRAEREEAREDDGVDDAGADVGRTGGVRPAEPFGCRPDQQAERGGGDVGDLAGEPGDQRDGDERLDGGDQIGEEHRAGVLQVNPEIEPAFEPAGLALGLAHDHAHVVRPEAGQPLEYRVDQPDDPEADPQGVLRPRRDAPLGGGWCAGHRGLLHSARAPLASLISTMRPVYGWGAGPRRPAGPGRTSPSGRPPGTTPHGYLTPILEIPNPGRPGR